jgi:hypothetical protein
LQVVLGDPRGLRRRPGRTSTTRTAVLEKPVTKYGNLDLYCRFNLHRILPA